MFPSYVTQFFTTLFRQGRGKRRLKESNRKVKERRDEVERGKNKWRINEIVSEKEKEENQERINKIVSEKEKEEENNQERKKDIVPEKEKDEKRKYEVVVPEGKLPLELWEKIGKHLVTSKDIVCFRSMCQLLRQALPSTLFPLQVPPPPNRYLNGPYFITEVNFYSVVLQSGQRVLVAFQQEHERGKVRPSFILPSGVDFDLYALSSSLKHRPPRHSLVATAYRLGLALPRFYSYYARADFDYSDTLSTKMVLISSNADGIINPSYATASDLSVIARLTTGKLALLRLSGSNRKNWEWDTSFCNDTFSDIISCKGQLFTVDYIGRAFVMDSNSLKMTQVAPRRLSDHDLLHSSKLVEACGELYLAGITDDKFVKVFKLSLRIGKWIEIEGYIGKDAFVLCASFNISIPRDALSVDCGNGVISCDYIKIPSLLLPDGSYNGYGLISFTTQHFPNSMAS